MRPLFDFLVPATSSFIFSNACKFTPSGGKLCISTKLIMPLRDADSPDYNQQKPLVSDSTGEHEPTALSATHLSQHNNDGKPTLLEWIVVRVEVTDTGYGIKPRDMAQSKLFCKLSLLSMKVNLIVRFSRFQSNRTRKTTRLVLDGMRLTIST